jgi:hypothetical protein
MSYITLQGCWCDIIILNVHAPTGAKIYDMKCSFYEELQCVFAKFAKFHMKMLLDFNAKVGGQDIFKPATVNEGLHKIGSDN